MPTFTTPLAFTNPPFTPDTKGVELRLARYRNPMVQGVTVYALSDGTFVQDYPTPENNNTAIPPFPLMPDNGPIPNEISRSYGIPGSSTAVVDTLVNPYVVTVYYGGRNYPITTAIATALTDYVTHGAGYGGNITNP